MRVTPTIVGFARNILGGNENVDEKLECFKK